MFSKLRKGITDKYSISSFFPKDQDLRFSYFENYNAVNEIAVAVTGNFNISRFKYDFTTVVTTLKKNLTVFSENMHM